MIALVNKIEYKVMVEEFNRSIYLKYVTEFRKERMSTIPEKYPKHLMQHGMTKA